MRSSHSVRHWNYADVFFALCAAMEKYVGAFLKKKQGNYHEYITFVDQKICSGS